MNTTDTTATFTTADALNLKALGEAIFADWYPNHRPGDPVPPMPPARMMDEARELALRHRMVAARSHLADRVEIVRTTAFMT